jgi:hypothetical protein
VSSGPSPRIAENLNRYLYQIVSADRLRCVPARKDVLPTFPRSVQGQHRVRKEPADQPSFSISFPGSLWSAISLDVGSLLWPAGSSCSRPVALLFDSTIPSVLGYNFNQIQSRMRRETPTCQWTTDRTVSAPQHSHWRQVFFAGFFTRRFRLHRTALLRCRELPRSHRLAEQRPLPRRVQSGPSCLAGGIARCWPTPSVKRMNSATEDIGRVLSPLFQYTCRGGEIGPPLELMLLPAVLFTDCRSREAPRDHFQVQGNAPSSYDPLAIDLTASFIS